jgi:bacillithiol system protein YtxJ
MKWISLNNENQIQDILNQSELPEIPAVLVFKHSTRCSISKMVLNRIESNWSLDDSIIPVYFLDLLNHRGISNRVAEVFQIKHESPQILLIKNGKCTYSATHNEIRIQDINAAISGLTRK